MPHFIRTYRMDRDGTRVDGFSTPAFIHNGDYFLSNVSVFQDGMVECWGLVDLETFRSKVRSGWVVTQPPADSKVRVSMLASFTATNATYWVDPEEFVKEIEDRIEVLNGRSTTLHLCQEAWKIYQAAPNVTTLHTLKTAYESIPRHNRIFVLGDQDRKDHPIRRVLYPGDYERRGPA